jgi:HEAT repeat protein
MRRCATGLLFLILATFHCHGQEAGGADPKVRRKAAKELARQGSDAIAQLREMLSDPDVEVRIEAVKSIVGIGTRHSLEPLVQATRDNDSEIQVRATDGLVNFYLPGYVRTGLTASLKRAGNRISGKFTDTNDQVIGLYIDVRTDIIEALGKLARGGSSMESRANAARALGILRGRAAVPDLLEAIRTKDTQVIYESLVALQKIGDRSAGPKVEFLLRDLEPKVQVAAIEAAGLLANRGALGQLHEVLNRTEKPKVRRAALASIAMLPDPTNRELLRRYLSDKDGELRESAAEGLGRIGDSSDLPLLEKAFAEEKKNSPRVSAAFALVMLGRTEMSELSPLQYLINTLNSSVRAGEARALLTEAARKPEIRRVLETSLARGTRDEKTELAWVLAHSGDRETIAYLEPLTRDPDTEVAEEAIRALRTLKARLP